MCAELIEYLRRAGHRVPHRRATWIRQLSSTVSLRDWDTLARMAHTLGPSNAPPGRVVAPNAHSPIRLAVISASTILAATIGGLLGPFVVTFPYSGIPLLVDARIDFAALARGVTRNSPGFLAFFTALYLTQGTWPAWLSFTLGWVGFIAAAATSNRLTTTNR